MLACHSLKPDLYECVKDEPQSKLWVQLDLNKYTALRPKPDMHLLKKLLDWSAGQHLVISSLLVSSLVLLA